MCRGKTVSATRTYWHPSLRPVRLRDAPGGASLVPARVGPVTVPPEAVAGASRPAPRAPSTFRARVGGGVASGPGACARLARVGRVVPSHPAGPRLGGWPAASSMDTAAIETPTSHDSSALTETSHPVLVHADTGIRIEPTVNA